MKTLGVWLDSPQRWTIEIWAWSFLTLVVVVLAICFQPIWLPISIVYLAVVSNYALVLTAAGARQASLARIAADKDTGPSLQDIETLLREFLKEFKDYLVTHTTLDKIDPDK